jgi:phenylalanine-4-hydroxylase
MLQQAYEDYTAEHFEVWAILYARQLEFLRGRVYDGYYEGLAALGFSAKEIPRIPNLSAHLDAIAGWRLRVVEDFLPPDEYLTTTATRMLPVTAFLRGLDELDHSKRPDMFHDVFGHTALLTIPAFCEYFEQLSALAVERIDDPQWVYLVANFNKWVTEFGLVTAADGTLRAYGAGLLSSSGELAWALGGALGEGPRRLPVDVRTMVATPHQRAEYQAQYFVLPSFDRLRDLVPELRAVLAEVSRPS